MTQSSILGGTRAAARATGKDVDMLGPSDSSDSGSDVQGETEMSTDADNPAELGGLPLGMGNDSDSSGTGERGSATGRDGIAGADIVPDRIIDSPDDEADLAADDDAYGDDVEGLVDRDESPDDDSGSVER